MGAVKAKTGKTRCFVHQLSLRHKLIAVIMLTCIASLLPAGIVFVAWEWVALRRAVVRDLSAHAGVLADHCKTPIAFQDPAMTQRILRTAEAIPFIQAASVYTSDGDLFAAYLREGADPFLPHADELADDPLFDGDLLTLARPILLHGETIGTIHLRASLRFVQAGLKRGVAVVAGILLVSAMAAYLVSSRLQRVISRPILHLAGVARLVSEKGQYAVRAEPHGRDEVGLLVQAFNEMLEQIQQRDEALVEAKESLEARVRERTAEMTAANDRLSREIAFRKRAEQVLVQRAERVVDHQKTLLRLTKGAKKDLNSMFKVATKEAARTLAVERVGIWFFEGKSSELVCRALYSLSRDAHENGPVLRAADYPAYFKAIENSRILPVNNAREDPRTRCFTQAYLEPLGITSMMDVPIRLHAKLLGVICYEHVGPPREWSLEEQDFAASVADMIALQAETNERRKLERALANANEHLAEIVRDLRRSNKELQDFAHVAAHDLKAPLRSIGTLTDWIASDYADKFDAPGRRQLGLLKGRVARLSELIDGILHYSEAGRAADRLERVDVKQLVREVIGLLDPPQHIRIAVVGRLPVVVSEKVRLGQVFHNLIDNAIQYMDKPQGRIEISCADDGKAWQFVIRDNGPGIEEKYFEKIFAMFQTLTPRDEHESTGLGLAIVKKIVERFGGEIRVESTLGEGAAFVFTLPKRETASTMMSLQAHTLN